MVINGSDLSVQTTVGYSIRWNFLYPRLQNKNLLSTNYSCDTGNKKLKDFTQCFSCSNWIKQSILYRLYPYSIFIFQSLQKMKLLLYPHGGSGNHGCEAIVRSTLKMIPTATLFSSNPDEDKRYGLDAICTLRAAQAPMSHLSLAYWKAFIRYRFGDKEAFDRTEFSLYFSKPTQMVMLCLSVGTIIATGACFHFIWSTNSFENKG